MDRDVSEQLPQLILSILLKHLLADRWVIGLQPFLDTLFVDQLGGVTLQFQKSRILVLNDNLVI